MEQVIDFIHDKLKYPRNGTKSMVYICTRITIETSYTSTNDVDGYYSWEVNLYHDNKLPRTFHISSNVRKYTIYLILKQIVSWSNE